MKKNLKYGLFFLACVWVCTGFAACYNTFLQKPGPFTVTFDSRGGDEVPSQTLKYGEKAVRPDEEPEQSGCIFDGWYSDSDCTAEYNFSKSVTANITLYAGWIAITRKYNVTFYTDGGSAVPTQRVEHRKKATPPTPDPIKSGFEFAGWYSDAALTAKYNFSATVTGNITLYAGWSPIMPNTFYTVTFIANGGNPPPALQNIANGGTVADPSAITPITKPPATKYDGWYHGYELDGWYREPNFTTNKWNFTIDPVTAPTTLYAKWIPKDMALIPAGTFLMGSPDGSGGINGTVREPGHEGDEVLHYVTLTKSYWMGKYPVTQEQYEAVMGVNRSEHKTVVAGSGENAAKLPVEKVTWYDAVEFCNFLSIQEGYDPVYTISGRTPVYNAANINSSYPINNAAVTADWSKNGYRLPTDAEWERAARAGAAEQLAFYNGNNYNAAGDGYIEALVEPIAWIHSNGSGQTHEVGLKQPNAWGMHDMIGNVWEWCWDWHSPHYCTADPVTDPRGPDAGVPSGPNPNGDARISRGCYYNDPAGFNRIANKWEGSVLNMDRGNVGFRIVRNAE